MQYNSFAQAYNAERQAANSAEKKRHDAAANKYAQIKKVLVQKYGQKAFNAMENMNPYVGMPEGIVREYQLALQDVVIYAYAFARVQSGFKIYLPTQSFAYTASYVNISCPKAIYCRNGKVSGVKW